MSTMLLRTRARACRDGLGASLHQEASFLGEVRPDERPAVLVGFVNLFHVREFAEEMGLDGVRVLAAPGEDAEEITARLWQATSSKLH